MFPIISLYSQTNSLTAEAERCMSSKHQLLRITYPTGKIQILKVKNDCKKSSDVWIRLS